VHIPGVEHRDTRAEDRQFTMNGYQRIRAALRGESPDTTPIMLHNFMLAAREAGITMEQYRRDPHAIARCLIESVEKYDLDGLLVDVDTATLAGALGVDVELPEDQPALSRGARLKLLEEVDDLEPVDIARYSRVQIWLEAVRLASRHFRDEVFIRGNCDQCAFSLASMMRTPYEWMLDLMDENNQARVYRLLEHCAEATAQFIRLMKQTGAHMVSNGDSPAGPELISPRLYRTFALPYEKQAAECAHGEGLPYALHICGNTNLILGDMTTSGADALELDYKTDMRMARTKMEGRVTFIGNLDPNGVLALGSPQLVEAKTLELLDCFQRSPRFILNAGCAIPPTTPSENIASMVRAARRWQGPRA
jgi:MtaA/CmuA family methyltransferase